MKNFSSSLAWLTVAEIIYNLSGYIVHSATGRILGPEAYGRYGLVITLTTMVIVLIGNGIPTTMSKYLSAAFEKSPEQIFGIRLSAMKLQAIIMGVVTLVFFFSAPAIAWLLHDPSLTPLFQLSALVIPTFAAASFNLYFFVGLHFFRLQAILKIIRSLGRVLFIIALAYIFGVKGAISGNILSPLVVFLVGFLLEEMLMKKYFPAAHTAKTTSTFPYRTLLRYAWPLTVFLLFYECILTFDLYFVKSLLQSDYQTGIYNAAITVGRIPYYLFYALAIILLPAIAKTTAENNMRETENLVNRSLRLLTLLLFPLVTLLALYAPQVLSLFYGERYEAAAAPMSIYAVGVGFLTIFYVLSFALNGAGLVKIPMKLAFFGFLGMIVLNFLLIPKWQLVGAALSTTLICLALTIGILVYTKRHFNVHIPIKTLLFSLTSILLILFFSRFLPHGAYSFIISGAVLFIAYFGILRFFGELADEDIAPFLKLFKKS
ncbi:MAG: oligosaccharide flippase family protein [Candidatus Moranbacteria bacterium]|nr:oligosaccharide flippase family protein [Candidatus Moranbacteria bacterium]